MVKKLFIAVTLVFGFFLMPTTSYACGTKTVKACCKKEVSSKIEKKQCCTTNNSKNKTNDCGGKCGHANCTTSTVAFSIISVNEIEFKNYNFELIGVKPKFYSLKSFISKGFTSVWLLPKIK